MNPQKFIILLLMLQISLKKLLRDVSGTILLFLLNNMHRNFHKIRVEKLLLLAGPDSDSPTGDFR